jgi:hypothetical protein
MKPTIEVTRTDEKNADRSWRAVVRLPATIKWSGYGINGQSTKDGPWVDGYGYSPEGAVQSAMVAIGKAIVAMTDHVTEPSEDAGKSVSS